MSILAELNTLLSPILPVETGVFSKETPEGYIVLTPLADSYALHGDNAPLVDVSEARISLFHKGNYIQIKNRIVNALLRADFSITGRRYIEHEDDTGFHHYAIDVAKHYDVEE